jgi:surface antigen
MRIVSMLLALLLALPTFALAVKIKDVDIKPDRPKAGDTVLFTVKTDTNATKVEIDFPAAPGPPLEMKSDKDHDKWQIKFKMSKSGEKKFKVTAYDKKGKKDSEEKKLQVGGGKISQPQPSKSQPIASQPKPTPLPQSSITNIGGLNLKSPAYTSENPFAQAGYGGQCTAFVWGRALEVIGKELDTTRNLDTARNGKYWFGMTKLPKGQTPKPKSVAVWGGDSISSYGHVAFVEDVDSDGNATINEANFRKYKSTIFGGGYDGSPIKLSQQQMSYRSGAGILLGYIYLK